MNIHTTRFGLLAVGRDEVLRFPGGLIGLEDCQNWTLAADRHVAGVCWLQCLSAPEIALAVVNPRRYVPHYRLRVTQRALAPLRLADRSCAAVLSIMARGEAGVSINLKAPLVINVPRRLGSQVIANDNQPVRLPVMMEAFHWRRSA